MSEYFGYILKVSACLAVFYSFYSVLLKNYTFFFFNRLYLLAGLILSFVIPFLKISIFKEQPEIFAQVSNLVNFYLVDVDNLPIQTLNSPSYVNVKQFHFSMLLPVVSELQTCVK
jgi:hypothetical protein